MLVCCADTESVLRSLRPLLGILRFIGAGAGVRLAGVWMSARAGAGCSYLASYDICVPLCLSVYHHIVYTHNYYSSACRGRCNDYRRIYMQTDL